MKSMPSSGAIHIIAASTLFLNSCTSMPSVWGLKYGEDKPQISFVSMNITAQANHQTTTTGDILIWNPNTNAAYANLQGHTCMLPADVYRINSTAMGANLSASPQGQTGPGGDINFSSAKAAAAVLLSANDIRTTFLSIALFNFCMLYANNKSPTTAQIATFLHVVDSAAKMTPDNGASTPLVALLNAPNDTQPADPSSAPHGASSPVAASAPVDASAPVAASAPHGGSEVGTTPPKQKHSK